MFADALLAKAREGVHVRLIYDWMGGLGKTWRAFWQHLRAGGVDVRCYNPPRVDSPFGWLSRDHRKMLAVDGHIGFVTGLCVGRMWVGVPEAQIEPWRDTGVEVRGPAVADSAWLCRIAAAHCIVQGSERRVDDAGIGCALATRRAVKG